MAAVDFEPEDDDLMDEDAGIDIESNSPRTQLPKLKSATTGGSSFASGAPKKTKGRGFREETDAERNNRFASNNFDSLVTDDGPGPQKSIEGWIILVTGVHEEAQDEDLRNAVMYVLCFRIRSMMEVPHLKSQLSHMPWQLIFVNPLDPLKVCLPSIVTEFLRQAKAAQLFTVSERNSSNDLLESDLSKTYGGVERFDSFFPFDPCLLKNCDRFIRPHFLYWSMVKTIGDDDDNNSSDEDINENEGFIDRDGDCFDDGMGRSFDENDPELDLDEFENSMNKMSITPKSNLKHRPMGFQLPPRMPARIRPSTSPESL